MKPAERIKEIIRVIVSMDVGLRILGKMKGDI